MGQHAPQIVNLISAGVAAAAMVVLGRSKHMLEVTRPRRCAACGRLIKAGRRCAQCA